MATACMAIAPTESHTSNNPYSALDAEVISVVRGGDTTRFQELVERYQSRLVRLAYRITRNSEEAEEVAQDSFVLAYRHLEDFHGESFYAWLAKIAVNQSLSRMRKRRHVEVPLEWRSETNDELMTFEIADSAPNPEDRSVERETKEMVAQAIGKLTPRFREAVKLYYMDQLTTEEMAERLHLSRETVKTHLHRARLKLRETLRACMSSRQQLRPALSF